MLVRAHWQTGGVPERDLLVLPISLPVGKHLWRVQWEPRIDGDEDRAHESLIVHNVGQLKEATFWKEPNQ